MGTTQIQPAPEGALDAALARAGAVSSQALQQARAVTDILAALRLDPDTLSAAALHIAGVTAGEVEQHFSPAIAQLVAGAHRLDAIEEVQHEPAEARARRAHAERLRKLLLTIAQDVRVVLIKLAERVVLLRAAGVDGQDAGNLARETLELYTPLANRLGIWQLKWELEDLAFRTLKPAAYTEIETLLAEKREDREAWLAHVADTLHAALAKAHIHAEVTSRPKHIYSIWRKMQRKGVDFARVFDVRALRVLVDDQAACYAALGVVHGLWPHIPGEFDDYIARPKNNLYQSLHTALLGPDGKTLEVQIRSHDMHSHAELGVAAHWRYKEGARGDAALDHKIAWLRRLLEAPEGEGGDLVEQFKAEVYQERVYAMTPRGEIVDLPQGATPLDFAYHIHTGLGHRCRGAKVNGHMVPLTHELKSGDQVEILAAKHGTPSRDWVNPHLGYLKSTHARSKVRAWFKQQDHGHNVTEGRMILERELKRLRLDGVNIAHLAERLKCADPEALYAALGHGEIHPGQLARAAQQENQAAQPETAPPPRPARATRGGASSADVVRIHGMGRLLTQLARCCRPLPSDAVVGFITRGRGVTVHRSDCPNMLRLAETQRERLIEVEWGIAGDARLGVDILIHAYDRAGLLRDITSLLAQEKVNINAVNTQTSKRDHIARMQLAIEVSGMDQLSQLLTRIAQMPHVIEARRR
jgi:GTP pyrophosphokinase